jgi:hypothetical protein
VRLLVALALLSPALPPGPEDVHDPSLRSAIELYAALRYREVLPILEKARASNRLDEKDLMAAFEIEGRVQAVLGDAPAAEAAFLEVLERRPDYRITWEESPIISQVFEHARARFEREQRAASPPSEPAPVQAAPSPPTIAVSAPAIEAATEPERSSPVAWIVAIAVGLAAAGVAGVLLLRSRSSSDPAVLDKWPLP